MSKIKYVGEGTKRAEVDGKVYIFTQASPVQDVKEESLVKHLLGKCGDRFIEEGKTPGETPQEIPEEKKKGRPKKKKEVK